MRELTEQEISEVSGGTLTSSFVSLGMGASASVASSAITGAVWGVRVGGLVGLGVGALVGVGYALATESDS